jgi:hypothetical protein
MPSTSAVTYPPVAGVTVLPGLQVSAYGAALTNLKVYDFTVTTSTWSTGSTAFYPAQYAISGLTTNDIPIALIPSTAPWPIALVGLMPATSTGGALNVLWGGNSTTATAAGISNNRAATLLTISYYTQSSSTTT